MATKKQQASKTKMTLEQAQRLNALLNKRQWLDKRKEALERAEASVNEELEALFLEVQPDSKTLCSGVQLVQSDKAVYDKKAVYDYVIERPELWAGLLKINAEGVQAVTPLVLRAELDPRAVYDLDTRAVNSVITTTDKQGKRNALGLPYDSVETVNSVRITKNALKTGQELLDSLDIVEGAE